jgi:G6PDH family F420-dependent oxidoreductase
MPKIGYFLSSEEHTPQALVEQARLAEEAGFEALWIADHYHPWNDEQGHSPFVWTVLGGIAQVCRLPVTTAVTCPTVRIHPAVVAQAAATCATLFEGRFVLGVGTGEALNEHIFGDAWPSADVRIEMLEEAVDVMRQLWKGEFTYHRGKHYTVENARIYTLPRSRPRSMSRRSGRRHWRRPRGSVTATSPRSPTPTWCRSGGRRREPANRRRRATRLLRRPTRTLQ